MAANNMNNKLIDEARDIETYGIIIWKWYDCDSDTGIINHDFTLSDSEYELHYNSDTEIE